MTPKPVSGAAAQPRPHLSFQSPVLAPAEAGALIRELRALGNVRVPEPSRLFGGAK